MKVQMRVNISSLVSMEVDTIHKTNVVLQQKMVDEVIEYMQKSPAHIGSINVSVYQNEDYAISRISVSELAKMCGAFLFLKYEDIPVDTPVSRVLRSHAYPDRYYVFQKAIPKMTFRCQLTGE